MYMVYLRGVQHFFKRASAVIVGWFALRTLKNRDL